VLINGLTNPQFYIQNVNGSTVTFNSTSNTTQTVLFCSLGNNTSPLTTYSFNTILTGTNANLYQINDGTASPINLTLVAVTTVNITNSSITYIGNTTNGTINITTSLDGTLYYYIRDVNDTTSPVDPVSLANITAALANHTNYIHNQSDYLTYLYITPRFIYVNSINTLAGVPQTIPIVTYMPDTTYEFCTYFNSSDGSVTTTTPNCTNFTTPNVPYPIYTFQLNFTSQLSSTQRNSLLCWFVNHTGAPLNLIVNLRGESCNLTGTTASLLYYNYTNNTYQTSTELIYLYSYDNSTTTPATYTNAAVSLFTGSVGANLTAANIASLNTAVGTNLTTSQYVGNSTY
jgi:hypothetical protein